MIKTLLVYDGKMSSAERIAERMSYLIGYAKVCELSEAPEDFSAYEGYCLVFNFYGAVTAARETEFLRAHKDDMKNSRIAMVGIGFSDMGFMNYIVNLEKTTNLSGIEGYFLTRESETERIGAEIGKLMRKPEHPMDKEKLFSEIENFVKAHNTLSLATAAGEYLRNTPLEYLYIDGQFFIITEGGNKFRGILENGRFCATIFDGYTKVGSTKGLQITGEAQIVPVGSKEYLDTMAARKITAEQLKQLPITMFIIKLVPMKYEMLNSEFKKDGYDVHQSMHTAFQERNWQAGAAYAKTSEKEKTGEKDVQSVRDTADQPGIPENEDSRKKTETAGGTVTGENTNSDEASLEKTGADSEASAENETAPVERSDDNGERAAGDKEQDEEPVDADQAARAAMVSSILKSEGRDGSEYLDDEEEENGEGTSEKKDKKPSIARTVGDAIREEFRKRKKKHREDIEDDPESEDGVEEYYDDDDDDDSFDDFDFDDDDFDEDEVFDSNKN